MTFLIIFLIAKKGLQEEVLYLSHSGEIYKRNFQRNMLVVYGVGWDEGDQFVLCFLLFQVAHLPFPQAPDHNLPPPQPTAEVNKVSSDALFHTWLVLFFTRQDPSTHQFVALATQNVMQMFLRHVKSEEHT